MNEKEVIEMIDNVLPTNYEVLDGDNNSIIVKDRVSKKIFEITVKDITE